jgi:hypothetical protein
VKLSSNTKSRMAEAIRGVHLEGALKKARKCCRQFEAFSSAVESEMLMSKL